MTLDLTVSQATLPEAWEKLPHEISVWNSSYADAVKECQEAENELVLIRAKLFTDIQVNPLDYGFSKAPSIDATNSIIDKQPPIIAAKDKVLQCKHNVNVTRGIVESLDIKRSALKYLTELTLAGFVNSANPTYIRRSE